jgi:D-psicose/D-tagatose/L-ribulose 3-epimerase
MGLPADKDITSSDDQMRQAGIDYLKRCVQTAAALGSPALGGLPYVPWLYFPDDNNLQPYRDRAAAAVREVAAVAADEGIVICLEIINRFETFMFNTVQEGLAFLRQVDHPAVKLHLDTYHMNMEEDHMGDAIRAASEHLGHFHCAASNRKLPGKGHINWSEIRTALDDIDYQGGLVIETFPNPMVETGRTINVWRPLVSDFDAEAAEAAQFIQRTLIDPA